MQYRRLVLSLVFALVAVLTALIGDASAKSIDVSWSQNSESDVTGYRIKFGTSSGNYGSPTDVGNLRTFRLSNVTAGQSYFFIVMAYNSGGQESNPSVEIRVDVPAAPPPPTATPTPFPTPTPTPQPRAGDNDGDGIDDAADPDDDNDGLSDVDEAARGTNPLSADTDRDGISDGQEIANGTNPLDPGSGEPSLGTTVCTEWNGFLGGMWNVAEMVNLSNRTLTAMITLYNQSGVALSQLGYAIPPGQQRDGLVHDLPGWALNAYGNICIHHDGSLGDLDGRMVYYKPAGARSRKLGEQYDFAFAMPFSNGKMGRQYVLFDTFQRSGNKLDRNNLITNWIQLSNFGGQVSGGVIRAFNVNGTLLGQTPVALAPGQRFDVAAHQYGANQIGMIEWVPDRDDVSFQLRNSHYLYDNVGNENSFASAFQQEGAFASGDDLIVPVTTQSAQSVYLQVSNASASPRATTIHLFDSNAVERFAPIPILLPAKGTWALQLDAYMPNRTGFAVVKGGSGGALVAGVVEYARNKKKSISYMYLVPGKPSNGLVVRGSYNNYLGQQSVIWVMNASMSTQSVLVSAVRSDGGAAMAPSAYILSPYTTRAFPITDTNNYGVVTVQGQVNNSLVSWVQRTRPDFVIPTPARE